MPTDIQAERARQAQDLRELQESYRKRKQAAEAENSDQLAKSRKTNAQKIKDESSSNEAAINHVRTEQRGKLEALREANEQAVTYERNAAAKRYHTTVKEGQDQLNTLTENLSDRQKLLNHQIEETGKAKAEETKRESKITEQVAKDQAAHRAAIVANEEAEIAEEHQRAQQVKAKMNIDNRNEIREMQEKNQDNLQSMRHENRKQIEQETHFAHEKLQHQNDENAKRLETSREQYGKAQQTMDTRAQKTMTEHEADANARIAKLDTDLTKELENKRLQGNKEMEDTRHYYDKNLAKIHLEGDEKIGNEKTMQEARIADLKRDNKIEVDDNKKEHHERMEDLNQMHHDEEQRARILYKQDLVQQRKQYEDQMQSNLKEFAKTVKNERDNLKITLAREKKEIINDIGKYRHMGQDPFYRIAQPAAELSETADHYILRAEVPEHERENMKVVVHDNKVILHGARRFEDNVENDGGKVATNSYQTFRQEIPIEHPVREKFIQQHWDNGVLTVRIPKA